MLSRTHGEYLHKDVQVQRSPWMGESCLPWTAASLSASMPPATFVHPCTSSLRLSVLKSVNDILRSHAVLYKNQTPCNRYPAALNERR